MNATDNWKIEFAKILAEEGMVELTGFRMGQSVRYTGPGRSPKAGTVGQIKAIGCETYLVKFKGVGGCCKCLPTEIEKA